MPFDFPDFPLTGQKYTYGSISYIWNGYGWVSEPPPDFVNVSGDTMTGQLTIRTPGTLGQLVLDNPVVNDVTAILFKKNNLNRWSLNATAGPEPGAEVGTNFSIRRYSDAGGLFGDVPLNINRKTGRVQVGQQPVDPNDIATKTYVDSIIGGGPGYLPLSGGTLTGALSVPYFYVNAPAGQNADIWGQVGGVGRWLMRLTDNFEWHRYSDAGAYLGSPMQISRATGMVNMGNGLSVTGHLYSYTSFSTPSGTVTNLSSDNANIVNCTSYGTFNLTAVSCNTLTANAITDYGTLTVHGAVTGYSNLSISGSMWVHGNNITIRGGGPAHHCVIWQNMSDDSRNMNTLAAYQGPPWYQTYSMRMQDDVYRSLTVYGSGATWSSYGYNAKEGIYGGPKSNCWNFDWNGSQLWAWIDNTALGAVAFQSDYRIKRNIENLPSMWAKVRSLRPVKYNFQDYTPPDPKSLGQTEYDGSEISDARIPPHYKLEQLKDVELDPHMPRISRSLVEGDDIEHWGFIAHEVQESLIMDAATGVKDQMDIIQSLNPWTTLAALTKALQEAMERIEMIELRLGMQPH